MALNLDAVGKKLGPVTKDYNWKDVVLYALGVGAGFSDLDYCYEKNLKVIPSFSIAAIFDFLSHYASNAEINLAGILHGEQDLIFHQPIPIEGTLTNTANELSPKYSFNLRPPLTSTSKITFFPKSRIRSTSAIKVP